jgi:hypothetical protein
VSNLVQTVHKWGYSGTSEKLSLIIKINLEFFGNACTKSEPLRFFQFSGCWLILCLLTYEFCLSLRKIARCSVILLLPLLGTPPSGICDFSRYWLLYHALSSFLLSTAVQYLMIPREEVELDDVTSYTIFNNKIYKISL